MKKGCKRALCAAVLLVLIISLSGCDALDEMRQQQAFYSADGVVYNGDAYRLLPPSSDLSLEYDYYKDNIYVTEADVPVLLSSSIYLDMLMPSVDGNFLESTTNSERMVYCREALYDELCQRILQGFTPEKLCYYYETYDADTDEMQAQFYTLTQEQMKAVNEVLESVEPMTAGAGWYQDYETMVWLEQSSEDMLFRRDFADISVYQGIYYLTQSVTEETSLVYTVPKEYESVFAQILQAKIEAEEDWNFGW